MCGRYNLRLTPTELQTIFDTLRAPEWEPRYNIAPTTNVPIVRAANDGREVSLARWGLVPSWSKEPKTRFPLINARAETVATQPSFRAAYKRRRCLVPASGYYEWTGPKGGKQPHHLTPPDGSSLAFAGLWECWHDELWSCTIITCEAADDVAHIHDRMPVILPEDAWPLWLDPETPVELLPSMLGPTTGVRTTTVKPLVNKVGFEGPECIEPV